jgi:very-short-patch-repair endonuclease
MKSNPRKKNLVKRLRRNMTEAEKKIWYAVRKKQLGVKFRGQQPIGKYIVDFACLELKLVVEVDGGEHFNSSTDRIRDQWLNNQGYKVLRFWNQEVSQNIDGVIQKIVSVVSPSPQGRGMSMNMSSPQGR